MSHEPECSHGVDTNWCWRLYTRREAAKRFRLEAASANIFFERAQRFNGIGHDLGIFNS